MAFNMYTAELSPVIDTSICPVAKFSCDALIGSVKTTEKVFSLTPAAK